MIMLSKWPWKAILLPFILVLLGLPGYARAELSSGAAGSDASIGVYYFPGWTEAPEEWWSPPWEKIKPFPEREPLLGWYPEGETWVAEKHIEWMHDYGIDFVIYDWYWKKDNRTALDHALQAYLRAKNRGLVRFTLLWANNYEVPESLQQFEAVVDYWINNYFNNPEFLKIDDKPVIYIFSPEKLRENAAKTGKSVKELLDIARAKAAAAGYKGIYFVACSQAIDYWVNDHIPNSGYDAISAYNYHRGYSGTYVEGGLSESYAELAAGYRQSWDWIIANSKLPYFVPVTSGWSKKPWGSFTAHDESISTPESFKAHLEDVRQRLKNNPERTMRTAVVCCWNEFGEGPYVEPTVKYGHMYLDAVKGVFGGGADDAAPQAGTAPPNWPWKGVSVSSLSSGPADIARLKDKLNLNSLSLTLDVREYAEKLRIQPEAALDENIR